MKNKENCLAYVKPELVAEWHPTKNGAITPYDVTSGSGRRVWWVCCKKHEWEARVDHRSKGVGCPYCSRKACWPGENDLATCFPALALEWNYEKNDSVPGKIAAKSNKVVWWRCKHGHEWQAPVNNRAAGNGCPYCTSKKILAGFNDLQSTHPLLAQEWNLEKNPSLSPSQVTAGSNKIVWWRCKHGHEWQSAISNRATGNDCPVCANKVVLVGYNDLTTTHPELLGEWSPKNGALQPSQFVAGSGAQAWWQCTYCGHEWKSRIVARSNGSGCPKCYDRNRTSFPEQAIYYYVKRKFPDAQNRCIGVIGGKTELDIYIPSKQIAVEYDGSYWHRGEGSKERKKYDLCAANGISLIRVKEEKMRWDAQSADYVIYVDNSLDSVIGAIGELLGVDLGSDIHKDKQLILSEFRKVVRAKSLAQQRPEIAQQWNFEKNNGLTPEMFYEYSNESVWWKCSKGHEWQAAISNRSNLGRGCPYCVGQIAVAGENDAFTLMPFLRQEWDVERNGNIDQRLTVGSNKSFWWVCNSCGNHWRTTISKRHMGRNCPKCAIARRSAARTKSTEVFEAQAQKASSAITLLEPYTNVKTPLHVQCNSCGHQWHAQPSRILKGICCPSCTRNKTQK